jgi:hypothetical protein
MANSGGAKMADWIVTYQDKKGNPHRTDVNVPDEFKTAQEVMDALTGGKVPDAYFQPDAIIGVERPRPLKLR